MSQRLLGRSDGRIQRALKVIHKLFVLGITDVGDVIELVRLYRAQLRRRRQVVGRTRADRRDKRLARAQWAVRWMIGLGFTETEIATAVDVKPCTIAHLLDPRDPRAVSRGTARRLVEATHTIGAERLKMLLPHVPITVLDTCNDKGLHVGAGTRETLAQETRQRILAGLLRASAPVPAVQGVHAFLAQIGEPDQGMYFFGAPFRGPESPEARLAYWRHLEHEAEHLLARFKTERVRLENALPKPPSPVDGRIA